MSEKILVVDDDTDTLKLVSLMLQRQGYDVALASTGTMALQKAVSERPDLIILDIMMPDMNGYDVCRRLRGSSTTRDIPIIMFTAKTLIDDKVAGFEAGADDYLTKPTHPAELAARVKHVLLKRAGGGDGDEIHQGSTVGMIGAKGGVGTSTLALNLSIALARNGRRPLILDMLLGHGGISQLLGIDRTNGMASIMLKTPDEIKPSVIDKELIAHTSGMRALLSSVSPKEALISINMESAQTLIRAARTMGNPVILDLGSGYSRLVSQIGRGIDQFVVIAEPTTMTLRMAQSLINQIETELRKPVRVVVMSRNAARLQLPWHEVEKVVEHNISAFITSAPELAFEAQESGTPMIVLQPHATISTQIEKLATEIKV